MTKPAAPHDGVTVVIPAHNAAAALDRVLPAWGAVLNGLGRPFEIVVTGERVDCPAESPELWQYAANAVPSLRELIGRDSMALDPDAPATIRLAGVGEYGRQLALAEPMPPICPVSWSPENVHVLPSSVDL